jgi:hypothetical protein
LECKEKGNVNEKGILQKKFNRNRVILLTGVSFCDEVIISLEGRNPSNKFF